MQIKSTKREVVWLCVFAVFIATLLVFCNKWVLDDGKTESSVMEMRQIAEQNVSDTSANFTRGALLASPSWTTSTLVTGDYAVPNFSSVPDATNYVLENVLSGHQWEGTEGNVQIPVFCKGVNVGTVQYEVQRFCADSPVVMAKAYYYEVDFSAYVADGFTNFHLANAEGKIIDFVNPESVMNSVMVATYNNYVMWGTTLSNFSTYRIVCDWAAVPSKFADKNSVDVSDGTEESAQWEDSLRMKNNIDDTVYTLRQGGGKAIRRNGSVLFLFPLRSPFYFAGGTFADIVITAEQQTPGFSTWETTTVDSGSLVFRSGNYLFVFQNSSLYERGYDVTYVWENIPEENPEVPLPDAPVKEGYTFVGWYYDAALTQAYDGAPIYADTTLYAKFEINTYTVTYDVNGGEALESITVNWNTAAPTPTPVRTGYNFVGWYTTDGVAYGGEAITANTTLTAHWRIKTYIVTFYVGEEKYKEITVEYGTVLSSAMKQAQIASYSAMTTEGVRLSKQNSIITEDTQVLVQELTGWEKYGDFVARNQWYTWLTVGVLGVLLILAVVGIVEMVRKR